MGTAKSITTIRRDGKLTTIEGGFTESQTKKAKFLGKLPEELTKKEMETPLKEFIKRENAKNAKK